MKVDSRCLRVVPLTFFPQSGHTLVTVISVTCCETMRVIGAQVGESEGQDVSVSAKFRVRELRRLNTLKNVKWKYLVYALAYVVVVWLSQLLVANPDPYLILGILLPI